jgi:PAB-dependent poly(A)-specific ribonuclease subunit 2
LLKASSKIEGDVMASIMTSDLGVDLFKSEISDKKKVNEDDSLPNPNRILHSNTLSSLCFEKSEVRETRKDNDRETRSKKADRDDMLVDSHDGIPMRYRKLQKPSHSKGSVFSNAKYNATGVWPGWDYPPSMPNAYAPPVLLYLYFIPEIRSILMSRQFDKHGKATATAVPPLSAELGCVFHQIDCLSNFARIYPDESMMAKVGAFVPANLLASFASMPEADGLALLDGSPAAVERARRPEAFVRFLLHHLHKELSSKNGGSDIIDNLHGFTFVCVNDFVTGSGAPVVSEHFSMTLDLSYVKKSEQVKFCQVLHSSLSKESPLRAWCKESKSYETIVQRKVAVSLPSVLAISCCCAGTGNEEGLSIWRENAPENGHWLPEFIEIEIEDSGNVVVREAVDGDGPGDRVWVELKGDSKLPSAVAEVVKAKLARKRKYCYRLDAVLSFVREDTGDHSADEVQGHHVLHVRVPSSYKRQAYEKQLAKAQTVASTNEASSDSGEVSKRLTIASAIKPNVLQKRIEDLKERIRAADESQSGDDDWVLFNGFVVSPTVAEDARAFHVSFKDPCLVIFRAMDDGGGSAKKERKNSDNGKEPSKLGLSVMQTKSIYSGRKPEFNPQRSSMLPGQGDLIAFDAEFVCVQEEESELTDRGSKVTVRETRLTLARISVIYCQSGTVIVDDYVVPCEPVVDYLTRFSGITAADLDPKKSPHHLVTMQSAYLKLRYLCERGCIFVGHGLSQDFLTVNLVVPPDQIIDTVEIFHQDRMRYVSLRFLTNYVFGRDMQQDVHDSVEDARAAYALYLKALELKKEGKFDKFLQDLYVYGAARDWKLGIDD